MQSNVVKMTTNRCKRRVVQGLFAFYVESVDWRPYDIEIRVRNTRIIVTNAVWNNHDFRILMNILFCIIQTAPHPTL